MSRIFCGSQRSLAPPSKALSMGPHPKSGALSAWTLSRQAEHCPRNPIPPNGALSTEIVSRQAEHCPLIQCFFVSGTLNRQAEHCPQKPYPAKRSTVHGTLSRSKAFWKNPAMLNLAFLLIEILLCCKNFAMLPPHALLFSVMSCFVASITYSNRHHGRVVQQSLF